MGFLVGFAVAIMTPPLLTPPLPPSTLSLRGLVNHPATGGSGPVLIARGNLMQVMTFFDDFTTFFRNQTVDAMEYASFIQALDNDDGDDDDNGGGAPLHGGPHAYISSGNVVFDAEEEKRNYPSRPSLLPLMGTIGAANYNQQTFTSPTSLPSTSLKPIKEGDDDIWDPREGTY